jgi:large subunit ribosomal protein L4
VKEGNFFTIEDFKLEQPKTKHISGLLQKLGLAGKKCLLVLGSTDEHVVKSVRNLQAVRTINAEELNTYEVTDCSALIFTEKALERFREVHKF